MAELDLPRGPRELSNSGRQRVRNADPHSTPLADPTHMTDYDLVRAYYFDPPAPHPHRVPSDEELIAR